LIQRNLDPYFCEVYRNEKLVQVSFSDLTREEQYGILANLSTKELRELCIKLSDALIFLGDYYNLEYKELVENTNEK